MTALSETALSQTGASETMHVLSLLLSSYTHSIIIAQTRTQKNQSLCAGVCCSSALLHRHFDNHLRTNCQVSVASEADIHDIIVKLKGLASDSGKRVGGKPAKLPSPP